jgi:hypothetical protein
MSQFDFSNISGESFGNINDIFFKKDGKSIIPQTQISPDDKVSAQSIVQHINTTANNYVKDGQTGNGNTIIQISKDVIGEEEDLQITLTRLEERRRSVSSVRNKELIDLNTGMEVKILDQTEMYNGMNLFSVRHENNGKIITYPRSMFVGRGKRFVPKDFYIREAERSIEDTIDKFGMQILNLVQDPNMLNETSDGKYLEIFLDEPLEIIGGMLVPDRVQIPVKRMFDLEYKLMILENVICLDNKIASLLFIDIWF